MSAANGRFVWFDLLTDDVEGAKEFYADVLGWKTQPMPKANYDVWSANEKQLGGVLTIARGLPSYWVGYVATDDVDGTVQRAERMKGRAVVPGTDIPDNGRYALLTDPQGAELGIYHANRDRPAPDLTAPGHFGWAELSATDWKSEWPFYSELFNWRPITRPEAARDVGDFFLFGRDPKQVLGAMSNAANRMQTKPHWLHYVNVKDVDQSAKRVSQSRGAVINGPLELPGGARVVHCRDPQGATFGLMTRRRA
jgi:uncharacterized protein